VTTAEAKAELDEVRNFWKAVYTACILRGDSDGMATRHASAAVASLITEHESQFEFPLSND
jgi:hypothetical protein